MGTASMPKDFSTPMLWEESEREALKGTDIEGQPTHVLLNSCNGKWTDGQNV